MTQFDRLRRMACGLLGLPLGLSLSLSLSWAVASPARADGASRCRTASRARRCERSIERMVES